MSFYTQSTIYTDWGILYHEEGASQLLLHEIRVVLWHASLNRDLETLLMLRPGCSSLLKAEMEVSENMSFSLPTHCVIRCQMNLKFINWKSGVDVVMGRSRLVLASSNQEAQLPCPCWSAHQQGSSGCGLFPSVAAYWDVWPGQPLRLPPIRWGGGSPIHVLPPLTPPKSSSSTHAGVPSGWFPVTSWFRQCRTCHSCKRSSTPGSFTSIGREWNDRPDLKATLTPYHLQTCMCDILTDSCCVG